MPCTACGTQNRPGSRFCDNCGAPLETACASCGQSNRADARFCANCGTAFTADPPAATPATTRTATATASPTAATPPASTAERRLVSVLFTDLVGFTTIAEDRDPEAVRDLLTRYFDTATEVVQLHGGTVEKFIGDAVMAVWGTPVAHEDDPERAVRAALELVSAVETLSPDLHARAGVLTGEAAVTLGATNQGMVAGDLVNTAARLQGVAEAGTVLVGETTMRAASRAIVFEPIGDHSLKGKTSPVPAWQAIRVVAARGGQGRADALEPPFVGRAEELRQLKDALHTVGRERRPRLVSVTGPGGIGKSRLVWELEKYIDGVAEDIWWHRGRSPSYGEGISFWALGEMVRRRVQLAEDDDEPTTRSRVAAALDAHIPDPAERERIGPALLTLLGVEEAPPGGRDALFPAWRLFFERIAEHGTTVLVFEDLQWADTGLLDFIDHVLDWSRGLPIMVVTLARPELFDRRPDWPARRRQLSALALEPLSNDEVRELLEGLVPGLPADALAAIVGRAEGIPLYAVEMVRGLLADGRIERRDDVYVPTGDLSELRVPESLRSLIASRLDAIDPADRALLQDASVLGQVFNADALGAVTGTDAADLEARLLDLVRRELLDVERDPRSPEIGQYKFVQSLIREVAYGTLARRDRRARHLAVARHYESLGDDELAGALASHYLAAHQASEAGAEADAVATQARLALTGAADRAATLGAHQQAVTHLRQALDLASDPADRAPLLDRAARSAASAATVEARGYAERALEAWHEVGDHTAAAWATARLGRTLLDASLLDEAVATLEAAIPGAEALDDPAPLAAILANLARGLMRLARTDEAVVAADRALAIAERENLDAVVAEAMVNKGSALSQQGRRREAVALQATALQIVQELGDRPVELRVRNNLASALSDEDPAKAMSIVREAIDVARDIGDRGMFIWLAGTAAIGAFEAGEGWEERLATIDEALQMAEVPFDRLRLRTLAAAIQLAQGTDPDRLLAEIVEAAGDSTNPDTRFGVALTRGVAALRGGDASAAYRHFMEAHETPTQNPGDAAKLALHAAVLSRDAERIREIASIIATLPGGGAWHAALRRQARAAVDAVDGRIEEAVAGFLEARAMQTRLGGHFSAAQWAVDALTLLPDRPELRAAALEARPRLVQLRAAPLLAQLDALVAAGTSPDPAAAATAEDPRSSLSRTS